MKIQEIEISKLRQYEKNPRRNDNAVPYVANSIKEFGFKVPIVVDRNNVIVAGHTRVKAAEELGMTSVPCVIADDLTDAQVKAFRLADNKTAEFSGWEWDLLAEELEGIEDIDMEDFGFTELPDLDIDQFFERKAKKDEKPDEPQRVQCPHCGEWFDLKP